LRLTQIFDEKIKQLKEDDFPFQQQLILCVMLLLSKKHNKQVEVGKAYDRFVRICKEKSISYDISNTSDFIQMCESLESRSLIDIHRKRETSVVRSMKLA